MATTTQSLTVPAREKAEQDCHCGCAPCDGSCCRLDCIVKPRFFCGQLLTDADLSAMLKWARDRFGLSRYRHGWGVVCGLDVRCDPRVPTGVVVTPGYAVDCCGDDIIVCENVPIDLKDKCREEEDPCADLRRTYERAALDQKTILGEGRRPSIAGLFGFPGGPEYTTQNRLRVVDIFLRYDEKPSDPSTAMGRGSCKQVSECEYSRTRESYKLTSEMGVIGNDPVSARAIKWAEGYRKCLEVLAKFRAQFPNNFPAADVRRWLIRWIDEHPQYQLCHLRSKLCREQDEYFTNQRNLVEVIFRLIQNCRNAYLNCDCFDCDDDARVPLARVWLLAEDRASNEGCRIITIDPYPPYRRPIQPECWPAPLGSVNVGRFIWHRWDEVCRAVDDLGLDVTRTEWTIPNTLGALAEQLDSDLFVGCDERRFAQVYTDEYLGPRVIGFSETGEQPQPGDCPTITVRSNEPISGAQLAFTADLTGPGASVQVTYNWSLSAGVVVQGQGTDTVNVSTEGTTAGQSLTATVEIGGLPAHCPRTASRTVNVPPSHPPNAPISIKADEFVVNENQDFGQVEQRLVKFGRELLEPPGTKGSVIAYSPRERGSLSAREVATRVKDFLVNKMEVDAAMVETVDGGRRNEVAVELWIVPRGAEPPRPTPGNVTGGGGTVDTEPVTPPNGAAGDDLTQIDGIGPSTANKLREAGISMFKDLASASIPDLKAIVPRLSEKVLGQWIEEAKRRVG